MTDDNDAVEALVRESAASAFDAGFSDRVAARLRAPAEASVSDALERQVRRVVPLVAAASLMLARHDFLSKCTARSPSETIPRSWLSFITGRRRMAFSLMSFAASPAPWSGETVVR